MARLVLATIVGIIAFAIGDTASAQGTAVTFYVATNGNDAWSGTVPDPASSDGPFATIPRARDAIQQLKYQQGGALRQPVTVAIRGGTYFLTELLLLGSYDSGTATAPITYTAYQNERPVISGGRRITGWRAAAVNGRAVWAADIPAAYRPDWYFHQLWVNGQRRTRARFPNTGLLTIAAVPDATSDWLRGQNRFQDAPGDIKPWNNLSDVNVVLFSQWVSAHLPIASIDETQRIVTFDRQTSLRMTENSLTSEVRPSQYYVENALEFLDAPGEWYLDRAAGTVYYAPVPGEDMATAEVIAPVLTRLIQLQGDQNNNVWVEYLTLRNLSFAYNDWFFPAADALDGGLAENFTYGAAVHADGVCHVLFDGLTVAHTGAHAIDFPRGGTDILVSKCELYDLGAGGVYLGPGDFDPAAPASQGNEISDCHIHDGGLVFSQASGIGLFQTSGSRVVHNWIHDFGSTGIALTGFPDYAASGAGNNLAELNHIHNIGIRAGGDGPYVSDLGAIYLGGERPGTRVHLNLIHDVAASRYGGNGIYLDSSSSGILVDQNIVFRISDSGFNLNYGRDNVVRNNVFALAGRDGISAVEGQLFKGYGDSQDPHLHLTFDTNIVYWRSATLFGGEFTGPSLAFDRNVYWREGGDTAQFTGAVSWTAWQAAGMDTHSLLADPLFTSPDLGDFSLKAGSPVPGIGWQPIDLSQLGPRPASPGPVSLPSLSSVPATRTAMNSPVSIAFTVADSLIGASAVVVSASSSNRVLLPLGSLAIDGAGANRTLTITPATNQAGVATITLTATNGGLPVSTSFVLTVVAPTVSIDKSNLQFAATSNGATFLASTASQSVRLTQSGAGAVTWTATSNQPWLKVTPAAGSGSAVLTIGVAFDASVATAGKTTGTITIALTGASNTVGQITVTLATVSSTAAVSPPFGSFDTPAGDSTVLAGSIALTGWTLDNVGVKEVELWRDLQPGETTPPGNSTPGDLRNGKIFIANATFVDNARPDVEGLNPTTPQNSRAGWGYLMLTWGLFGQGNGTYRFYAFGVDQEGNTATIGAKTVVISNNTATKPFGSIDTPGIGGDASGPNFGWGLTPKVNGAATCKIQPSGVQYSIDSGPLQPVVYGDARTDIAGAFAGFSNTAAAGGHAIIDWTALTNGSHTIGWLITDDCNRSDGVGSRFFNVTTGTALRTAESAVAAAEPPSPVASSRASDTESDVAITVGRGYGQLPEIVDPAATGSRTVEMKQGERIEIRVPRGFESAYQLGPSGQRRALPIGATWDADSGTFYWQPAAGFLGRYRLVFTRSSERISVRVMVLSAVRDPS